MRDHYFINMISDKIISYISNEYIEDINEIIITNTYNTNINFQLREIIDYIENYLNSSKTDTYYINLKLSLKTNLFKILNESNGIHCCNKLACLYNENDDDNNN